MIWFMLHVQPNGFEIQVCYGLCLIQTIQKLSSISFLCIDHHLHDKTVRLFCLMALPSQRHLLLRQKITNGAVRPRRDRQRIHLGAQQTMIRFVGCADNQFVLRPRAWH